MVSRRRLLLRWSKLWSRLVPGVLRTMVRRGKDKAFKYIGKSDADDETPASFSE
jgi:hypothetical protein